MHGCCNRYLNGMQFEFKFWANLLWSLSHRCPWEKKLAWWDLSVNVSYRKKMGNYRHQGSSVTLWTYEYIFSARCINSSDWSDFWVTIEWNYPIELVWIIVCQWFGFWFRIYRMLSRAMLLLWLVHHKIRRTRFVEIKVEEKRLHLITKCRFYFTYNTIYFRTIWMRFKTI